MTSTDRLPGRSRGASGLRVSALGLGLMGMSDLYGRADEAESADAVAGTRHGAAQMAFLDSERTGCRR